MARERKLTKEALFQSTKDTLLSHGYVGFTFSIIAESLQVSRGTLYKYYENKEELITEYMVYEMDLFLHELQKIDEHEGFEARFDYLLYIIFKDREIHQIREMAAHIPKTLNAKVKKNSEQLDILHLDMYTYLQNFVELGRKEKLLKPTIPDGLILGFIFQTVAIPNHFGIPYYNWVDSIKEVIRHGMFTKQ